MIDRSINLRQAETRQLPTLAEVARAAGVSRSAVSAVLNPTRSMKAIRVSEETGRRIRETAARLGYSANINARALRSGRTHAISVLFSLVGPHASAAVVNDLAVRMKARNYITNIADTLVDPDMTIQALNDAASRNVEAVVVQFNQQLARNPAVVESLDRFFAVVLITDEKVDLPHDQIIHDRDAAFNEVAAYFSETGRRHPVMALTGAAGSAKPGIFRAALARHGLDLPPQRIIPVPHDRKELGRKHAEAISAYRAAGGTLDALFCLPDEGAAGAVHALVHAGLRVPEDVAVVGFNNSPFSQFLTPPLASIERDDARVVEQVESFLFSRLKDVSLDPRQVTVPMRFVHRHSAGLLPRKDGCDD